MFVWSGLTLVELMVVFAIVGILVAIMLRRCSTVRDRGIETEIIAEMVVYNKIGRIAQISTGSCNIICVTHGAATSTKVLACVKSILTTSKQFVCISNSHVFAALTPSGATEYCRVDSIGYKVPITAAPGSGITKCL